MKLLDTHLRQDAMLAELTSKIEPVYPLRDDNDETEKCGDAPSRLFARIKTLGDLNCGEDLPYLIKPGIWRKGVMILNADWGAGKTSLAMALAEAGLSGDGNAVFQPTGQFRTLFIFNEAETLLSYYGEYALERLGINKAEFSRWIRFFDLDDDRNAQIADPTHGNDFLDRMSRVLAMAQKQMGGPVDMIVLDSAQFNVSAGSINSDETIRPYVMPWKSLAKKHNLGLVISWLANKSGGIAGNNSFPGIADVVLGIEGREVNERRKVRTLKNRIGTPFPESSFDIRSSDGLRREITDWRIETHGVDVDGTPSERPIRASDIRKMKALDLLTECSPIHEDDLREKLRPFITFKTPIKDEASAIRKGLKRALDDLREYKSVDYDPKSGMYTLRNNISLESKS